VSDSIDPRPGRQVGGPDDSRRRPQETGRGRTGGPRGQARGARDDKPDRGHRDSGTRGPKRFVGKGPERNDPLTDEERLARELKSVRSRHDDPEISEDVQPGDLDRLARNELRTLSKENADEVARHLVMAARLIERDPLLAHSHAVSAARRAGRIAVVRESLAITAYATGDFALALRELRTFRRISGSDNQIALMVDSERGVGRPDRALETGRSVDRGRLPVEVRVSLAVAMSGARLDMEQPTEALDELQIPELDPNLAFSWSPDLFHAYADVLEELGSAEQASEWRARADRAVSALMDSGSNETIEVVEEERVDGEEESDEGTESPHPT